MAKNYQLIHKLSRYKSNRLEKTNTSSSSRGSAHFDSSTTIYLGTCLTSRESVTIKVTDLDELNDLQLILNEILFTRSLRHVNILPLLSCFVNAQQVWRVYPHIYFGSCRDILDYIDAFYSSSGGGGVDDDEDTLVDRADEQKRLCFNEQSLQPITKSLLAALDYMHSRHVIHRRVEPASVFIGCQGHVYLGCMDSAVCLMSHGTLMRRLHEFPHALLPLDYVAPEILQQNLIGYTTKSDIYSLGVTLCELANGVNPFIGCEKVQMLYEKLAGYDVGLWDRSILNAESKNIFLPVCLTENPKVIASVQRRYFSEKFRNFVDLCVQRNSVVRPSAGELLTHPYLKKAKLQSCLSTFQMSIIADGLFVGGRSASSNGGGDLPNKQANINSNHNYHQQQQQQQSQPATANSSQTNLNDSPVSLTNTVTSTTVSWNF